MCRVRPPLGTDSPQMEQGWGDDGDEEWRRCGEDADRRVSGLPSSSSSVLLLLLLVTSSWYTRKRLGANRISVAVSLNYQNFNIKPSVCS